jgi:hypothetical protein
MKFFKFGYLSGLSKDVGLFAILQYSYCIHWTLLFDGFQYVI